jgi:hypothetical protein
VLIRDTDFPPILFALGAIYLWLLGFQSADSITFLVVEVAEEDIVIVRSRGVYGI